MGCELDGVVAVILSPRFQLDARFAIVKSWHAINEET
jgi:hypothetical protein